MSETRLAAVAAFCAFAVLGCSGGGPVPTYPVTGVVKMADGSPLAGGRILCRPSDDAKYTARGEIASDGTFELTTFEVGDGAVAGVHKVMISPPVSRDSLDAVAKRGQKTPAKIDSRYEDLAKTPLTITVSADGSTENHFELEVEPPRGGRRR